MQSTSVQARLTSVFVPEGHGVFNVLSSELSATSIQVTVIIFLITIKKGPGIDPRSLGIFSGTSDSSMCPGVDSASKNEYQVIPGGKDGRCLRVTTLPPSRAECLEILEP